MGESREGEGRAEGPTTIHTAADVVRAIFEGEPDWEEGRIVRMGDDLYQVSILRRGEGLPEVNLYRITEEGEVEPTS